MELILKNERYEVLGDWHTHSRYSHGIGEIEDYVKVAIGKGLKTIGVSDHGPGHVGFGVSRKKLAEMKAEIIRLRQVYPEIEIMFGIESNILVTKDKLDIKPEEFDFFDFICAGWHFGTIDALTLSGFTNTFANFVHPVYAKASKKQIAINTEAVVNAIGQGGVKFLTHPGRSAPLDLAEVTDVCVRTGTLIEINTNSMTLYPKDLEDMAQKGAYFIISSDAHRPDRVGDFKRAETLLNKTDIDPALVVNLKKAQD